MSINSDDSPAHIVISDCESMDDEISNSNGKIVSITDSVEEELNKFQQRRRDEKRERSSDRENRASPVRFDFGYRSEGKSRRRDNDADDRKSSIHNDNYSLCVFCDVKITSSVQSSMHYSGKPHAKKIRNIYEGMVNDSDEDDNPSKRIKTLNDIDYFHCRPCNLRFTNTFHAGRHLKTMHGDILDDIQSAHEVGDDFEDENSEVIAAEKSAPEIASTVGPNRKGKRFDCKLCMISTSSAEHLKDHYNGKVHRKRAKATKNEAVGEPITESEFFCDLCKIGAPSAKELANHTIGKAHVKKLKALDKQQHNDEKLRRPIPNLNIEMFNTGY